jgi:hypothetical protein
VSRCRDLVAGVDHPHAAFIVDMRKLIHGIPLFPLEVGIAHRRDLAGTNHADNDTLIIYLHRFLHVVPAGGAHL